MDRTLFSVTVSQTDDNREFWTTRPWVGDSSDALREASIIVAPWIGFREGEEVLFPQGTTDFVRSLRKQLPVVVAADSSSYAEIALYSKVWRYPIIFVTAVMLPTLTGALSNILSDQIGAQKPNDMIEMKLVVESPGGPCIAVEYKGPPDSALNTVVEQIERCLPRGSGTDRQVENRDTRNSDDVR